jgi:hypothetical protein
MARTASGDRGSEVERQGWLAAVVQFCRERPLGAIGARW